MDKKDYRLLRDLTSELIAEGYSLDDITVAYEKLADKKKNIDDKRKKLLAAGEDYLRVISPDYSEEEIKTTLKGLERDLRYFESLR